MKKREIILDGKDSDWYEKAIFILKNNSNVKRPRDLLKYAEELIEDSCKKGIVSCRQEYLAKNTFQDAVINSIFICGVTMLIGSCILLFL